MFNLKKIVVIEIIIIFAISALSLIAYHEFLKEIRILESIIISLSAQAEESSSLMYRCTDAMQQTRKFLPQFITVPE